MTIIQRSAIVPHTAEEMYKLVNAIEDYPDFVPWCKQTVVHSRDEDEIHATLSFEGGGFNKSFTTCNRLQKNKMIEMRLIDGPFKHLEGFWRFEHHEDTHCMVKLDLEFELANKILGMAFGAVFNQVANSLVDAFSKRASEVYGNNQS
ncbi:MAG: type II toxin-antitoxin system RatA family toxin [Gammaproteobacteria bacterium]|nr:type II toxin-antitoxin system RatA family toxin [Gammaproteobacteria bacterium]